ncbi:MAG: hypothetical protein IKO68_12135 [Oscillospiraceae bacterium]|nr:hypothetical protein [Oscillospiraceae bacterium]MBR6861729.1 hypothetical protein [Acidaminococcaceae bacterium]
MNNTLTYEERQLMAIYLGDSDGTREGLITTLESMRTYLNPDEEAELLTLTDSALEQLRGMDDEAFSQLELFPDL